MQKASTDQCQYPKPILLPTGYMQWSPEILPFQLFRIGSVAIAGIPGEMTVQAGRRLEAAIMSAMAPLGVTRVLLTGLANEYSGYITTPEEFPSQQYEGASTLFGALTLDAYKEIFQELGFAIAGGTEVVSNATAPDLSGAQAFIWKSAMDHDERPALEQFGQVLFQSTKDVNRGASLQVIFRSANPNNALRRNDTYFRIERDLGGGNWQMVAWDNTPDTKMHWALSNSPIVGPTGPISQMCPGDPCLWSTTGIVWTVPADATPGQYRIRLFGSWKHGVTRELTPFVGVAEFTVR